jgi:predicted RNA binding protein YcfA (HicA-like mRNA interferase family)
MPKLVPISAKKMIKILGRLGFECVRSKGSHHFFFNRETNKTTTIPVHGKEELSVGLLKEILRDIDLSVDIYDNLRRKV